MAGKACNHTGENCDSCLYLHSIAFARIVSFERLRRKYARLVTVKDKFPDLVRLICDVCVFETEHILGQARDKEVENMPVSCLLDDRGGLSNDGKLGLCKAVQSMLFVSTEELGDMEYIMKLIEQYDDISTTEIYEKAAELVQIQDALEMEDDEAMRILRMYQAGKRTGLFQEAMLDMFTRSKGVTVDATVIVI